MLSGNLAPDGAVIKVTAASAELLQHRGRAYVFETRDQMMTEIDRDFEGDTWFPQYDRSRWRESQRERHVTADGMKFDFALYEPA